MTEHIGKNLFNEPEVVFQWEGAWYKLPFYLLEDITPECPRLDLWLSCSRTRGPGTEREHIDQLKQILSNQMPLMVAYKIYDL